VSSDTDKLFTRMLSEAGFPTTESAMQARWDALNEQQGSQITNSSKWSPFWRLISAIVTEPMKALVSALVTTILPQTFLKTASGAWLDIYAWGVDLARKEAVQAQGAITFTRTNSAGELLIPAGTVIESPSINGHVYRVAVLQNTTMVDKQLTTDIAVRAEKTGTAYNLGPGYYSILPQPISGIAAVTNGENWLTAPGADEETDEELRLRCRNQFSAVGQYHHDAAYTADIASFAGIRTDYIVFEHEAPRGPGSANAYIMVDSGPAPQEFVDTINAHIRDAGNHGHGDDMLCFPMPALAVNLTATVHPVPNLSDEKAAALLQDVEGRIRAAFRENTDYDMTRTWPHNRFSLSVLGDELHAQLPDMASIEFDRDDIVAALELPVLASLTVTNGGA